MEKEKHYIDVTYYEKISRKTSLEDNPKYNEYRRKWKENPRKHITGDFPIHLDIESTAACNLKCPMCFQSFNPPKPGFMEMQLFKKLIDEGAEKGLCSIKLNFRGEPLLHPKIADMVKYAKDNGIIEVMFNTNATLLTEEKSRQLIIAGLDKIICSVDGYTKEFYESIRRGATFEKTLENIKRIQKIKREMGTDKPVLRTQMVILKSIKNPDEFIKNYVDFWGKIADHVAVEDEIEWDYSKIKGNVVYEPFRCPQPWQRLFVRWDGVITLCCGDLYEDMPLGNAYDTTIEEVWKSSRMENIRRLLKNGESHKIPICKVCGNRRKVIEDMQKEDEHRPGHKD